MQSPCSFTVFFNLWYLTWQLKSYLYEVFPEHSTWFSYNQLMILRVHLWFYTCILLACTLFKLYDYYNKYDGPRSLATVEGGLGCGHQTLKTQPWIFIVLHFCFLHSVSEERASCGDFRIKEIVGIFSPDLLPVSSTALGIHSHRIPI